MTVNTIPEILLSLNTQDVLKTMLYLFLACCGSTSFFPRKQVAELVKNKRFETQN